MHEHSYFYIAVRSWFGLGVVDRRFSRSSIPMTVDQGAVVHAPRAFRLRSFKAEMALFGRPTLGFSGAAGRFVDRDERRHETAS
jgi:hypothetical protein